MIEIVAALVYYATWDKLDRRTHVKIAWIYAGAAYLSLVIINGIVTFMLTPGQWLATGDFWDGFFNVFGITPLQKNIEAAALLGQMRDPNVRRGLALTMRVMRVVGSQGNK